MRVCVCVCVCICVFVFVYVCVCAPLVLDAYLVMPAWDEKIRSLQNGLVYECIEAPSLDFIAPISEVRGKSEHTMSSKIITRMKLLFSNYLGIAVTA